jgi:hypothetical protein
MIVLIIGLFILLAFWDLPFLIKNRLKREIAVYSAVYVCALTLAVLLTLGIKLPSPLYPMITLIRDVLHLAYPS